MKKYLKIPGYVSILIFVLCSCNQEQNTFDQAKDSESTTELESFITNYPRSIYVDSAKILIEEINWQEASQIHTFDAYEAYLQKYPAGNFVDSAKFYMETPLVIHGTLIDKEGKPLNGKSMQIYIANAETTVDTHVEDSQKSGIVRQIEGTGTLAMSLEGVEAGGALKLIDGKIVNPSAKTDEDGHFNFNLSASFLEGESELLIGVNYHGSNFITESYSLVDEEGNPLILKIDKPTKIKYLGEVRSLKE